MGTSPAGQDEDATIIQSVNLEPLSRESIKVTQKQDPVLSQVVDWLKTDARPTTSDVEGGGRKLLLYWSQWGRLFLKDGLVFRRWQNEGTGPEIYQQICLPEGLAPLYVLHDSPSAITIHLSVSKTLQSAEKMLLAGHA